MTLFPKQIWTFTVCRIHSDKFPQQNILAGDEAVIVSNWSWVNQDRVEWKRMNKRCLKKLIQLNWSRCFYIVKSYLFRDGSPTKTTALREVRARNQEKLLERNFCQPDLTSVWLGKKEKLRIMNCFEKHRSMTWMFDRCIINNTVLFSVAWQVLKINSKKTFHPLWLHQDCLLLQLTHIYSPNKKPRIKFSSKSKHI